MLSNDLFQSALHSLRHTLRTGFDISMRLELVLKSVFVCPSLYWKSRTLGREYSLVLVLFNNRHLIEEDIMKTFLIH